MFGTREDFCREPIWFMMVDLSSPYDTLLVHTALAKFMVVPHYVYLKMKLPS
jgi:hypothetical protein